MNKFTEIAKQISSTSELMTGRTQITSDEVCAQGVLTIDGIDVINYVEEKTGEFIEYAVLTFKEIPDKYYTAGMITTKIVKGWIDGIENARDEIASANIRYALNKSKTKGGNNVYVPIIA